MALKILLAEDEEALSRVYKAALEHQGFEVDQAFNGQKAVDLAAQNAYQVIIMDIMMPIKTGIEALKEIRSSGNTTHVIMLTAMAEVDDRVTGLDAGADDYLTKPISLKELLARLRSLERRVSETFTAKILTLGSVRLDQEEQELVAGNAIRLSSRETKSTNDQVTRLTNLINSLVALSRLEEQPDIVIQDVDFSYITEDAAEDFKGPVVRDGKSFVMDITPDIHVKAEEKSLFELVTLLVDNANKYCDSEGTVTVRLRQVGRTRKRARLLEVAGVARDIADPWYTGDFDGTYRDVTLGCKSLLEQLKKEL